MTAYELCLATSSDGAPPTASSTKVSSLCQAVSLHRVHSRLLKMVTFQNDHLTHRTLLTWLQMESEGVGLLFTLLRREP